MGLWSEKTQLPFLRQPVVVMTRDGWERWPEAQVWAGNVEGLSLRKAVDIRQWSSTKEDQREDSRQGTSKRHRETREAKLGKGGAPGRAQAEDVLCTLEASCLPGLSGGHCNGEMQGLHSNANVCVFSCFVFHMSLSLAFSFLTAES